MDLFSVFYAQLAEIKLEMIVGERGGKNIEELNVCM